MATRATDRFAGSVPLGTPTNVDALIQWHRDEGNAEFAAEGDSWDDQALADGLVLVTYEGLDHNPDWRMWEHFWQRVADLLGVSADTAE